MIKLFQKVSVFYISRFEAAVKAMKECGKQPWTEKVSKEDRQQLQYLYKQATQGVVSQMTQEKGTGPNFDSPMNSFRTIIGKQTAQGATQDDILKQQLKQIKSETTESKTTFTENIKTPEDAGIKQTKATQSLAKGQTVNLNEPKPKINEDVLKSKPEETAKERYGNRTGSQSIPGSQAPGANLYKQKGEGKMKMRSKEQAEDEYVKLAKDILQKHDKGEKYVNDF